MASSCKEVFLEIGPEVRISFHDPPEFFNPPFETPDQLIDIKGEARVC
jgi:hypothetical protein